MSQGSIETYLKSREEALNFPDSERENTNSIKCTKEIWLKLIQDHVIEFGENFSGETIKIISDLKSKKIDILPYWIPTLEPPNGFPSFIKYISFDKIDDNLIMDDQLSSRIVDDSKWQEFIFDVYNASKACKSTENFIRSSGFNSLFSKLHFRFKYGSSIIQYPSQQIDLVFNKWLSYFESKRLSLFLLYRPEISESNKTSRYFGFIIKIHINLSDVKVLSADRNVTGLDNKLKGIRAKTNPLRTHEIGEVRKEKVNSNAKITPTAASDCRCF